MYTIGRLARRARVKADSIRFYEREGLVFHASKTPAGYRLYTDAAVRRLAFIRHAKSCGFSLAEIRELLQMHGVDASTRNVTSRLIAKKKNQIDDTIAVLQAMSSALGSVLTSRDEAAGNAPDEESPVVMALENQLSEQGGKRIGAADNAPDAIRSVGPRVRGAARAHT